MTEAFLALVPLYGLPFLAIVTTLSCLGLPAPVSVVMMLMGSLAVAGDFSPVTVIITALAAAIGGDQLGFFIGRAGGGPIMARIARKPSGRQALDKARHEIDRHGGTGVFFTRWLLAPLGPYVNLITGATGFSWARFTLFGALGEIVWVGLYVGLGMVFSDNVITIAELASDLSGFAVGAAVTLYLGWRLVKVLRNG